MKQSGTRDIDIGIPREQRAAIAQGLSRLLADTYTLYLKTHNYHWNVTGPMFNTLHQMFELQYNELALAVDQIAERIRALGLRAPGSYREYAALTQALSGHDARLLAEIDAYASGSFAPAYTISQQIHGATYALAGQLAQG